MVPVYNPDAMDASCEPYLPFQTLYKCKRRLPEADGNILATHLVDQLVHDFPVNEIQWAFSLLHYGDIDAQGRKNGRVFDADGSTTYYDHASRQPLELHHLVVGEDHITVHLHPWRRGGFRPYSDQNVCRC